MASLGTRLRATDLSGGILYEAVSPWFCSLCASLEMESERDHFSMFGNKLEDVLSVGWRSGE